MRRTPRRAVPALLFLLSLPGCGARLYPVQGTVTVDGQPLTKGMVVFERAEGGEPITARGEVRPDGSYRLSTHKPGDGVPPGVYRALVNPLDMSDVPDEQKDLPFDQKYTKFQTSELRFEVKPGPNDIRIALTKAPRPRR